LTATPICCARLNAFYACLMRHLRDPFTPDGNINATTASSGVFIRAIQSGNWAFPLSIDALGGMNRMDAITVFIMPVVPRSIVNTVRATVFGSLRR